MGLHWFTGLFLALSGEEGSLVWLEDGAMQGLLLCPLGCKARARMASLHQWACAESTGLLPDLSAIAQCTGLWSSAVSVELSFCSCVFSRVCFSWLHWGDNLSLVILLKALCWGWLFFVTMKFTTRGVHLVCSRPLFTVVLSVWAAPYYSQEPAGLVWFFRSVEMQRSPVCFWPTTLPFSTQRPLWMWHRVILFPCHMAGLFLFMYVWKRHSAT